MRTLVYGSWGLPGITAGLYFAAERLPTASGWGLPGITAGLYFMNDKDWYARVGVYRESPLVYTRSHHRWHRTSLGFTGNHRWSILCTWNAPDFGRLGFSGNHRWSILQYPDSRRGSEVGVYRESPLVYTSVRLLPSRRTVGVYRESPLVYTFFALCRSRERLGFTGNHRWSILNRFRPAFDYLLGFTGNHRWSILYRLLNRQQISFYQGICAGIQYSPSQKSTP